ncbi:MAG TPA: OmpA family protein [Gemmatimonadales bacterium]|nr:OmpA family protein [Gemmatimonadales bacterium]
MSSPLRRPHVLLLASCLLVPVAGCANKARTGAVIGAAGGAGVGAAVGKATGSTSRGAIIGAVVGGGVGAYIGQRMDKQAAELAQNIPGATVQRIGEGIHVTFDSGLLYDFDSDVVKPAARANLDALATSLDHYPNTDLLIVGHTDAIGAASYNQELSERRASAAAAYLVSQNVSRSRIHTEGRGVTEPIASNDTEAGRAANRRVEVAIYASEAYRKQLLERGTP